MPWSGRVLDFSVRRDLRAFLEPSKSRESESDKEERHSICSCGHSVSMHFLHWILLAVLLRLVYSTHQVYIYI